MLPRSLPLLAASTIAASCGGDVLEPVSSLSPAIYGGDGRIDATLHPRRELRERARSVVALIPRTDAASMGEGRWPEPLPTLGDALELCPGEAFAHQPVLPSCTGVLVAPDRVLTARHCVSSKADCAAVWLVFDFALDEHAQLLPLDAAGVFGCVEVLAMGEGEGRADDFALLRLDRPAGADRAPVPLRPEGTPMVEGDAIAVIGHPSGLPLKIDDGGRVRTDLTGRTTYRITSDTFGGSSGSAVLDAEGHLAGIVVGGAEDYEHADGCTRAIVYAEGEGRELVVPIDRVREAIDGSAAVEEAELTGCACLRRPRRPTPFASLLACACLMSRRAARRRRRG